jgi:two-component system cell cycle sensor histidine kinase PleC
LAELHDGTFELKSRLHYGTEVLVTFPRKRVIEPLPRIVEAGRWLKEHQNSIRSLGTRA